MSKIQLNKATDIVERKVTLIGRQPIMFDRYPGDNDTKLTPDQKLYLSPDGRKVIGIPVINIMSFLTAHNTNSAPKRLRDKRKFKDTANACLSFVELALISFRSCAMTSRLFLASSLTTKTGKAACGFTGL